MVFFFQEKFLQKNGVKLQLKNHKLYILTVKLDLIFSNYMHGQQVSCVGLLLVVDLWMHACLFSLSLSYCLFPLLYPPLFVILLLSTNTHVLF